jgi:hypothetical protein
VETIPLRRTEEKQLVLEDRTTQSETKNVFDKLGRPLQSTQPIFRRDRV